MGEQVFVHVHLYILMSVTDQMAKVSKHSFLE